MTENTHNYCHCNAAYNEFDDRRCGARVNNADARFLPGHDARLKGVLIRAGIAETPVYTVNGEEYAMEVATRYGFAYQVRDGIAKGKARIAAKEARKAGKKASQVGDLEMYDHAATEVKVGRWWYRISNVTDAGIEYEAKDGSIKTTGTDAQVR